MVFKLPADTKIDDQGSVRNRLSQLVILFSLFSNLFLALLKITAGITGQSSALLADGINSSSDVIHSFVLNFFFKLSRKPPDKEHPYGHGQMESISSVIIGAFVLTTGGVIFASAIEKFFMILQPGSEPEFNKVYTLYIAGFTVLLKFILTIYTSSVAKTSRNLAIKSLAADHKNDIFASLAVIIGIIGNLNRFFWADPLAAAVVAAIIFKTGLTIIREAGNELMDVHLDAETLEQVKKIILQHSSVLFIEDVESHKYGPYFTLNITISVNGNIAVHEADKISDDIETNLKESLQFLRSVYVHFHSA